MTVMGCNGYVRSNKAHGIGGNWVGQFATEGSWSGCVHGKCNRNGSGRYSGNGMTIGYDSAEVNIGDKVVTDIRVTVGQNDAAFPCDVGYQNICVWWAQGKRHTAMCIKEEVCRPGVKALTGLAALARNDGHTPANLDDRGFEGYQRVASWDVPSSSSQSYARETNTQGHFMYSLYKKKGFCATECSRIETTDFKLQALPTEPISGTRATMFGEVNNCGTTRDVIKNIKWDSQAWKTKSHRATFSESWEDMFTTSVRDMVRVDVKAAQTFTIAAPVGDVGGSLSREIGLAYEHEWSSSTTQSKGATSTIEEATTNTSRDIVSV